MSEETLNRLERVTARLEQLEARLNSSSASQGNIAPVTGVPNGNAVTSDAPVGPVVVAFDTLLKEHLSPVVEKAKLCGPDVEKIVQEFQNAVLTQRQMLVLAAKCKKPADEETFQK